MNKEEVKSEGVLDGMAERYWREMERFGLGDFKGNPVVLPELSASFGDQIGTKKFYGDKKEVFREAHSG